MVRTRIVLLVFLAGLTMRAIAQPAISISGSVIDGGGNPVAGAYVSLMFNGNGATSDSTGAFAISTQTAAGAVQRQARAMAPTVAGNSVRFFLVNQSPVSIDVFAMNGQRVCALPGRLLLAGSYSFAPAAQGLSAGVYFVKVQIGSSVTLCRLPLLAGVHAAPGLRPIAAERSEGALSKRLQVLDSIQDTLVAAKGGYKTFKKGINSYTLQNQICVLTAVPKSPETAIYSERVTKTIDWAHTDVQVWDYTAAHADSSLHLSSTGLNGACTANPYQGNTKCWACTCGTIGWSNWGFTVSAAVGEVDMSGFYGGSIHFYIRGLSPSVGAFIGWFAGSSYKIDLATLGYTADNQWHEISIPLASFGSVDYANITDYLMFVAPVGSGGAYTAGSTYFLDDITWRPAP